MTVAPDPGPEVDPRVARSRTAVLDAAVTLLAERGWSGTTVEAVAELSGVAKTTIYRHWSSRTDLVLDAFNSLFGAPGFQETDDLCADLVTMMCSLADALEQARWSRCLPALVEGAERDPELASLATALARERRGPLHVRLRSAVASGALKPDTDVELMAHVLADPLFYRRLVSKERSPTRFVETLVDRALAAFGA